MVRIAAVADLHLGIEMNGQLAAQLTDVQERADIFMVAGDVTRLGDVSEAEVFAREVADLPIPVVAVLGNHDYHHDQEELVAKALEQVGIVVLEGDSVVLDVAGAKVGVAGVKGFGGGFAGACGSDFGEPEMKSFVRHTQQVAKRLEEQLIAVEGTDIRVALLHYAPIPETLAGERLEIFPFLGSYLLADAVDRAGADIVFHGHAHVGTERGATPAGIPVYNVAQQVIGGPYRVFEVA